MKRQSGFNLIELMVVVTIAAVLLGIAVPSFREFTATQRVKSAAFDFAAALLQARSEAIKRNTSVSVAEAAGGWTNGWTVLAGTNTLATQEATSNVTITPTPATASVDFQGTGRITSTLMFQFGGTNTDAVRCVTISVSGAPNTTTASCPTP